MKQELLKATDWRVTYSDGETIETSAKLLSDCHKKGLEIASAQYFDLGKWQKVIPSVIDRANSRKNKSSGATQPKSGLLPLEQRRMTFRELLNGGLL